MNSPRRTLARLEQLYQRVEQMRELELRSAAAAVAEVARGRAAEQVRRTDTALAAHAALAEGDRAGWLAAEAERAPSDRRLHRLHLAQVERAAIADERAAEHRGSRVEHAQVARVLELECRRVESAAERQAQAASDDRYLARRVWLAQRQAGSAADRDS